MQYAAEVTYPTPEGTSNGLVQLCGQCSVVFVYIMGPLRTGERLVRRVAGAHERAAGGERRRRLAAQGRAAQGETRPRGPTPAADGRLAVAVAAAAAGPCGAGCAAPARSDRLAR